MGRFAKNVWGDKKEVDNQIGVRIAFIELRGKLEDREEDKMRRGNMEESRQRG